MAHPKESGGWQDIGQQVPEQPEGTRDRTFGNREAFPRDVDEGLGRHVAPERGKPVAGDGMVRPNLAEEFDEDFSEGEDEAPTVPGRRSAMKSGLPPGLE